MIISRTPYRISLFGGGTDYPEWYLKNSGAVIAASIDKYCYLSCRYLPPFFDYRHRIVWSKIENCIDKSEITHPAVKAIIDLLKIERALEIHHIGDLPARSGMGSSSSFSVGLLNALSALNGKMLTKLELAKEAIHVEQELLKEAVGSQDQVSAAYGGFNRIEFKTNSEISVTPITVSQNRVSELEQHLLLFYTGLARTSSEIAKKFVEQVDKKSEHLAAMQKMTDSALRLICSDQDILELGDLLHQAWITKRAFSDAVSNQYIDQMYDKARKAGAMGGKITGAGGGGFMLLFAAPAAHAKIEEALSEFIRVPFRFEYSGSQIIFAHNEIDYSTAELARNFQTFQKFRELNHIESK